MDRAYKSGASATPPTAPASPSIGYPTEGNPAIPTEATKPGPWWYHMMTEELMAVILAAGITPAQGTLTQLKQALDALYMPLTGGAAGAVQGAFKNLALSATGTNAIISVSFDELVLENGTNAYVTERGVSGTINTATTGAGGLDTGALAGSTWYSIWRIRKADGTAAFLFSLSSTAPTMPSGYTFKARIGWFRTDASGNKYPLAFIQSGRDVRYLVASGSNVAALPQMASGTAGSVSTPTWVAVGVSSFVPPTASVLSVVLKSGTANAGSSMAAPNNSYGAYNSTTNSPPLLIDKLSTFIAAACGDLLLESSNIYWAANVSSQLLCVGWTDNF